MLARCRKLPRIAQDMGHPTTGIVEGLGCPFATGYLLLRPFDHRQMQFGQVRHFGRPMVHLEVDVQVVVAIPRSMDGITPQSLQVGRHAADPSCRDQQVTAKLEIECRKFGVIGILCKSSQTLIHWQQAPFITAQIQGNATIQLTVGTDMLIPQGYILLVGSSSEQVCQLLLQLIVIKIGGAHADQDDGFRGILDPQQRIGSSQGSAFRQQDTYPCLVLVTSSTRQFITTRQLTTHHQVIGFDDTGRMFRTVHGEREMDGLIGIGCQIEHA